MLYSILLSICLFNMNPGNLARSKSTIKTKSEIYSQLTMETPERCH